MRRTTLSTLAARLAVRRVLPVLSVALVACGGRAVDERTADDEGSTDDDGSRDDDGAGAQGGDGDGPDIPDKDRPPLSLPGTPVSECFNSVTGASTVRGLNPTRQYDSISFWELDATHALSVPVEILGTPCASGEHPGACPEPPPPYVGFYFLGFETAHALIVTAGDVWEPLGYHEVRAFLGVIDTANEAAVIAWTEGWAVRCEEMTEDDGGYYFLREACGDEEVIHISRDAVISAGAYCRGAS